MYIYIYIYIYIHIYVYIYIYVRVCTCVRAYVCGLCVYVYVYVCVCVCINIYTSRPYNRYYEVLKFKPIANQQEMLIDIQNIRCKCCNMPQHKMRSFSALP